MKLTHKILCLPCMTSFPLLLVTSLLILSRQFWMTGGMSTESALNTILFWNVGVGIMTTMLTTGWAWRLGKTFSFCLAGISSIAGDITSGDLSQANETARDLTSQKQNETHDETDQLLLTVASMTENLHALVRQVQRSGNQVGSSASELFATAQHQETMVTQQMDAMRNVRTSIEEIAEITTHLVETMNQVAETSQETADIASRGQQDLIRMKEAMSQMEHASTLISDRLETINEKADTITTVITTISKVAEKTNLLSLNAAIEAEKAGDYGHGFTVIAREIRRLADQTGFATLDIEHMVRDMQSAVSSGVMEMDKFVAEVRHGVEDVNGISTQLTHIIHEVQRLSPNFEHVNEAMEQQSHNARKIQAAVGRLAEDMQETKETLQESYSAIEHLKYTVHDLQEEVSRFQISLHILKDIEIFQPFSNEAINALGERIQGHHFSPGDTIVQQGDLTDSLYIIAKGVVSISVRFEDGRSLEVARKAAGEMFGEISLLTGEPRTATVTAATNAYLFEIKKDDIAPFIEAEPKMAERLSMILTKNKMDTEAKQKQKQSHTQHVNKHAIYTQTLDKIQRFFGLTQ